MPKYTAKFFGTLDTIIDRTFTFDAYSRVYWREYGPLSVIPSDTRFSHSSWPFAVLYAAERYETGFCECIVRDNFNKYMDRTVPYAGIYDRDRAILQSQEALTVIDLTGSNCQKMGIPVGVIRNTDHRAGRSFAKALFDYRPDVDAIKYPSRLEDGGLCVAVFERALYKIDAIRTTPLNRLRETTRLLQDYRIQIRPESESENG